MQLRSGTLLQGGKYCITQVLGQGGFGITYEAEQVLLHRKVALKEFFMKDCCERDANTSHVTVGIGAQRTLVQKFRGKFIREAQMMASMDHPHIVRVVDVFEENGTAYYVMDYLPGGSLADKVRKEGSLSETLAEEYIRQVAEALSYIHGKDTVHLDVKPSNILLNAKGEAVLIDFGTSKHYDDSGEQTSSTPIGISKGYAPLEQSRDGDVSQFTPSTDIYALGTTLYYLVTGTVPPEATIVYEDGLDRPKGISDKIWHAIEQAMKPRRKDRPQDISAFLALLGDDEEITIYDSNPTSKSSPQSGSLSNPEPVPGGNKPKAWLWALLAGVVVAGVVVTLILGGKGEQTDKENSGVLSDSVAVVTETPAAAASLTSSSAPSSEPAVPGSVKISSSPAGAVIWLDGKNTKKTTPEILEDLEPGKHKVKLVLDGYNDYNGTISITSGKRADLSQTLVMKEAPATASSSQTPAQTQPTVPAKQEPASTPAEKPTTGRENGHEWVDLGLSVKWATCNVGASSPSDYGNYYAWGETSRKRDYSCENYKFRVSGNDIVRNATFSKYNTKSGRGSVDNKTRLDLSDDAARANWGGKWRMPTKAEFDELVSNCTYTWTTQGGKNGYRVTSKKNGNSIFLPAAGFSPRRWASAIDAGSIGFYWSSSLSSDSPHYAWELNFISSSFTTGIINRSDGFPVRPVTE